MEDSLTHISDISEGEPKFFKKHFNYLYEAVVAISFNKDIEDQGIKKMALEIIVSVVERIPSLVKKNKEILSKIIEMIFFQMIQIEDNISEEW